MNRKAFHQLLKKYIDGKCSDEEERLIDAWYQLLDDKSLLPSTQEEMNGIEERLWNKIRNSIGIEKKTETKKIKYLWVKIAVAASIIAIIFLGIIYYPSKKINESVIETKVKEGLTEIKNETTSAKEIRMGDSSLITLEPGARIAFPKKFAADKREVFLEGMASFKVSKNAERPFFVYDDNIITQVLGTSFSVKKINQQIEVEVFTGKVAVYENSAQQKQNNQNKTNGVVITPNQKVIYYSSNHQFVTSLVEVPVIVPSSENKKISPIKFLYEDALVSKVLSDLQDEYKIQIVVENDRINQCFFTGDITEQSLYDKLNLVCQAIQATYEIRGTSIVINGKGCN
ncbi:MAG: FecR family protein [Chitinophagaceae bacterium]